MVTKLPRSDKTWSYFLDGLGAAFGHTREQLQAEILAATNEVRADFGLLPVKHLPKPRVRIAAGRGRSW
jgi:hypothetical protein